MLTVGVAGATGLYGLGMEPLIGGMRDRTIGARDWAGAVAGCHLLLMALLFKTLLFNVRCSAVNLGRTVGVHVPGSVPVAGDATCGGDVVSGDQGP